MEEKAEGGKVIDAAFPSIVFLGTPEFAVPSLRKLVSAKVPVGAVVTQPDRPSGRGKRLSAPPVKVVAEGFGIPVLQPQRIRESEVIDRIQSFGAECAVVVAYGQILPQAFLDAFTLGALNVHASLLPAYRGAAPLQRCLLAGETRTGVTIMLLDAGMDTGPVLAQREVLMGQDTSFGSLHDEMAQAGAELLLETLREWRAGRIVPVPQEDTLATYAPPLLKKEGRILWEAAAGQIVNTIRAFDPSPGAYGLFQGQRLKFFQAVLLPWKGSGRAGEVVGCGEKGLVVLGGDGQGLAIGGLQMEGQRRLAAAAFLRGRAMPIGSLLE
jgi:methionyl-tRNA formyltransferase